MTQESPGDRDASSELLMHLEVYRQRPDVNAVVHAHPPLATGFAVAGVPLDRAVLAEVICTLGSIPIVDYATPSTPELPAAVRQYIKAHDGLLLANHGALTVGAEVYGAYYKMETVEHFAKISLVARMLGGERLISQEEVLRLQALRGKYGIARRPSAWTTTCQARAARSTPRARSCARRRRRRASGSCRTPPAASGQGARRPRVASMVMQKFG
jgi:ribulose-5-phosphate 4-epimerase/fuculose-1-phosphate aldolase